MFINYISHIATLKLTIDKLCLSLIPYQQHDVKHFLIDVTDRAVDFTNQLRIVAEHVL